MEQFKPDSSPIVYYISGKEHDERVLFFHAAFANHEMFKSQNMDMPQKFNEVMEEFWQSGSL